MAVGLSLIFGVMRVVNFAHGDMMVWGMYLALFLSERARLDPYVSFVVCAAVLFLLGALVQRTLVAAHQAEKDHISVAVLDLRTINPYDWDAIATHVERTNRVVIAHEDQVMCGFGAELAARIAGELFEHLDAPVRRVGALNAPVAYYPDLEDAILPQSSDVLKAIRETARY